MKDKMTRLERALLKKANEKKNNFWWASASFHHTKSLLTSFVGKRVTLFI